MGKKMLNVLLVLSFVVVEACAEAATLRGIVIANELGGPPVPNVEVSASGTNPAKTAANGTFLLEFPKKQPGDSMTLKLLSKGQNKTVTVKLEELQS